MAAKCSIPVIDLHDFPNQSSKLIAACEDWGCFRLLNYQEILPPTLLAETKAVVRSLIDLPPEIKRRTVDVTGGTGYLAPSPRNPLYESLGLCDMASPSDLDKFCSQLDASPHQREVFTRYAEAAYELCVKIGEKIAEGLGVKSENIGFQKWSCQFRINKYHFTPESVGSCGVETHTDSGFLAILQEDEDVGGLEVMKKSGEFIPIDPWPDTLLVNLGDMATVWSNGRFCNVKHRVQCKEAKTRVSFAAFLLAPREPMEPLAELVDDEHPRAYVPITVEEYRNLRSQTNLPAGEALALLYTPTFKK